MLAGVWLQPSHFPKEPERRAVSAKTLARQKKPIPVLPSCSGSTVELEQGPLGGHVAKPRLRSLFLGDELESPGRRVAPASFPPGLPFKAVFVVPSPISHILTCLGTKSFSLLSVTLARAFYDLKLTFYCF